MVVTCPCQCQGIGQAVRCHREDGQMLQARGWALSSCVSSLACQPLPGAAEGPQGGVAHTATGPWAWDLSGGKQGGPMRGALEEGTALTSNPWVGVPSYRPPLL